jgi:hypothetical protein
MKDCPKCGKKHFNGTGECDCGHAFAEIVAPTDALMTPKEAIIHTSKTAEEPPDPVFKAIVGFVLGVAGLAAWTNPFFGLPTTLTGLIVSHGGIESSKRGLAIAGLLLSSAGVVLTITHARVLEFVAR